MADEAPVSAAARAALIGGGNKLKMLEDFINRYEQKYFIPSGGSYMDPRTKTIFTMIKESAEGYYAPGQGTGDSYIAADALVLGIAPHEAPLQGAYDPTTGLLSEASVAEASKLNLYCYILSDPRSKVSADIRSLIKEVMNWLSAPSGGGPPPQVSLLPSFIYDMGLRDRLTVKPEIGDIVKVRSDGTDILAGVCTEITKVNVAYLLITDPDISPPRQSPSRMKSKYAKTIGGQLMCISTPAPLYNPSSMTISDAGLAFIARQEPARRWVYDGLGTSTKFKEWVGNAPGADTRWKWADYYIPKEYAITNEWLTKYKGPTPFGAESVPSIGRGHAIKIQDDNSKYSSLSGDPINERELFANNFKKDLIGTPVRQKRMELTKRAGKKYNSPDPNPARIGYSSEGGDDPPLSDSMLNYLTRADVEARCKYFKTNINKPITQAQFDALASISFDRGARFSTLVKIIVPAINQGECEKAVKAILVDPLSETAQEAVLSGNTEKEKRRTREATLFATGEYGGDNTPANLVNHLNEQRRAAAEIFLSSRGANKAWVGKTKWFDAQYAQAPGASTRLVDTAAGTKPEDRTAQSYNLQPAPQKPGNKKEAVGVPAGAPAGTTT